MPPLAELHLHLDGSVEPDTLLEIDPSLTREEIAANTSYSDFAGFLRSFVWVNKRLRTPADYARVARRLFQRLESEGVTYAEVILSVGVVLWKQQSLPGIYDALQREASHSRITVRWIFDAIRQFGAGEMAGPASVWEALEIGSERIGHGIRAIEDPALLAHLAAKNIPLEVCITSNLRTGAVASLAAHPIRRLYDAGVPILINSDDPALFGCTLASEYALAAREFGFTESELAALARNAFRYAFKESIAVGR
jgi:aminodeoxyfutalosine deaminase